ncbi:MAG: diacylglycerol kinase family protein [Bacteroidetes bacterium]|nr:MAG: diacylglycerol kinase family protein [Bacteroidota bacterium]
MRNYFIARIRSFGYAFRGIGIFFRDTPHAQIHLLAIVLISALGGWLGLSATEWCLILICMGLVIVAEALNSALEYLTDLASPEVHPLAGKAKDVAAGAVLLGVIFAAGVWGIIFLPKLWALVSPAG